MASASAGHPRGEGKTGPGAGELEGVQHCQVGRGARGAESFGRCCDRVAPLEVADQGNGGEQRVTSHNEAVHHQGDNEGEWESKVSSGRVRGGDGADRVTIYWVTPRGGRG